MGNNDQMHLFYEVCGVTFDPVEWVEDLKIVKTPEGWRFECPEPYVRYSIAYATREDAVTGAKRFCLLRSRLGE